MSHHQFKPGDTVRIRGRRSAGTVLRRGAVIDSWIVRLDGEKYPLTYLATELRGVA